MALLFLARRLAMLLASLLVASFAIFGSMHLAPGNPVSALAGGRGLQPEVVRQLEERYHLDEPFLAQYWYWLSDALHGDLGVSMALRADVSTVVADRVGTTAQLVLYAALLICVVGIALGVVAGLRPGLLDNSVLVVTALSAALPSFVAAMVLILVFAVQLQWFPALGTGTGILGSVHHLTLPAIALAASALAIVARITRAAIREESRREHVQTAVSRGIPRRQVVTRHILRNAAIPITTICAITVASLIALSSVVETAFGLNGVGAYLVTAAQTKDLAVVQGISLILVAAFVVVNVIADVLYSLLDPRVPLGSRAQ